MPAVDVVEAAVAAAAVTAAAAAAETGAVAVCCFPHWQQQCSSSELQGTRLSVTEDESQHTIGLILFNISSQCFLLKEALIEVPGTLRDTFISLAVVLKGFFAINE